MRYLYQTRREDQPPASPTEILVGYAYVSTTLQQAIFEELAKGPLTKQELLRHLLRHRALGWFRCWWVPRRLPVVLRELRETRRVAFIRIEYRKVHAFKYVLLKGNPKASRPVPEP